MKLLLDHFVIASTEFGALALNTMNFFFVIFRQAVIFVPQLPSAPKEERRKERLEKKKEKGENIDGREK